MYSDKDREKDKAYQSKKMQRFPSETYGKAIGLHSIYKNWILPNGETAETMILKVLDSPYYIFKELLKLNPELEKLKISDEIKEHYLNNNQFGGIGKDIYYHVCYGLISKFTIQDIEHFLLKGTLDNNQVIENYNSRRKWYSILEKNGASIGWAASIETLKEISDYLKLDYQKYL